MQRKSSNFQLFNFSEQKKSSDQFEFENNNRLVNQ